MKNTRFFLAPLLAFFDFKIYNDAVAAGAKKAFVFLAYLSLISTVVLATQLTKVNTFIDWVKQTVPAMTVSNQGMKLDIPGLKTMTHPELGQIAAFDDSKETIQPAEMEGYHLFVTSKMIYWRAEANGPIQSGAIGAKAKNAFKAHVDGKVLGQGVSRLYFPVALFLAIAVFVMSFVQKVAAAALFAVLGLLVQFFVPQKPGFEKLFILASYAMSVGIVFSALQLIPGLAPLFPGVLGALLVLVYFVIAITLQPKPEQK